MNINDYLTLMNEIPTDDLMRVTTSVTSKLNVTIVDTMSLATSSSSGWGGGWW